MVCAGRYSEQENVTTTVCVLYAEVARRFVKVQGKIKDADTAVPWSSLGGRRLMSTANGGSTACHA
jgi:hypothetical protein